MDRTNDALARRRDDVIRRLYLRRRADSGQEIESEMQDRVASICPSVLPYLRDWMIVPNTPALANAGSERPMMSACFVFGVPDSLEGILATHYKAGMIQKFGGGTGYWMGDISPAGKPLRSGGSSSGMMSFLAHFNHLTDTIKQGGIRRGANMAQVGFDHPEIRDFLRAKVDPVALETMARNPATGCHELPGVLENFNISVQARDSFMQAVANGDAEESSLFDLMARCAWLTADPGIVFWDTAQSGVRFPEHGPVIGTNPCGEQWMRDNEACNLLAINLACLLKGGEIDLALYGELIRAGVDYLNAVVDQGWFPVEEITQAVKATRRIGLGIMGLADLLILMGVPYNSEQARNIWRDLIAFHCAEARAYSDAQGYRNENVTTIAPTGTTSMLPGVNGGIEPYFAFEAFNSNSHGDYKLRFPIVERCPDERALVTAHEIHWRDHLAMQAIAQEHVDNAVTKTINMPADATVEDVKAAYMQAWRLGCKGVTVYRDGSRGKQVYAKAAPAPAGQFCPRGGCDE